jgi:hypothetical protein
MTPAEPVTRKSQQKQALHHCHHCHHSLSIEDREEEKRGYRGV